MQNFYIGILFHVQISHIKKYFPFEDKCTYKARKKKQEPSQIPCWQRPSLMQKLFIAMIVCIQRAQSLLWPVNARTK